MRPDGCRTDRMGLFMAAEGQTGRVYVRRTTVRQGIDHLGRLGDWMSEVSDCIKNPAEVNWSGHGPRRYEFRAMSGERNRARTIEAFAVR